MLQLKRKVDSDKVSFKRVETPVTIYAEVKVNRLTEFDNELRSLIDGLQITHSTVLRILLRTNRFKINQSLQRLWMAGIIHRDIHGLVISTKATDDDKDLRDFIERSFKTHLT